MSTSRTTSARRLIVPATIVAIALSAACASTSSMDEGVSPDPNPALDSAPVTDTMTIELRS